MQSREQELFEKLFSPHNRRDFIKRAGALGLSASALTAFLEACGSTTTGGSTPTATVNMAGPIDMQTLTTNAKKEGQLHAIGIPPEWADYKDILAGYTSNYGILVNYLSLAQINGHLSAKQEFAQGMN
jgi:putative spermidine/putrescine transport system substrate-binding protein